MNSAWPEEVVDFESFLRGAGLACQHREEFVSFGNKLLEYANAGIAVRVGSDRSVWFIDIADLAGRPEEWYDAPILRDLLFGPGEDLLYLTEKIKLIEENWERIMELFLPLRQEDTHARLAALKEERAKRLFPGFYSDEVT